MCRHVSECLISPLRPGSLSRGPAVGLEGRNFQCHPREKGWRLRSVARDLFRCVCTMKPQSEPREIITDQILHPGIVAKEIVQVQLVQPIIRPAFLRISEIHFETVPPAFLLPVCHKIQAVATVTKCACLEHCGQKRHLWCIRDFAYSHTWRPWYIQHNSIWGRKIKTAPKSWVEYYQYTL